MKTIALVQPCKPSPSLAQLRRQFLRGQTYHGTEEGRVNGAEVRHGERSRRQELGWVRNSKVAGDVDVYVGSNTDDDRKLPEAALPGRSPKG